MTPPPVFALLPVVQAMEFAILLVPFSEIQSIPMLFVLIPLMPVVVVVIVDSDPSFSTNCTSRAHYANYKKRAQQE
jgi:hypothetical protein